LLQRKPDRQVTPDHVFPQFEEFGESMDVFSIHDPASLHVAFDRSFGPVQRHQVIHSPAVGGCFSLARQEH
jgi:hypothetical protein